jgi:hypothetical protein
LAAGATLLWAGTALAQTYTGDVAIDEEDLALGQKHYSPYLDQSYPNRVFFGDTHLHTSYSTDAGMIGGYWVDSEFDPAQRAYYYVRVLEIPTPSWLAYDKAFFGNIDLPEDAVMVQQERAYTSPIWYTLEK